MKKQNCAIAALIALFLFLGLASVSVVQCSIRFWRYSQMPAVFINSYCNILQTDISVSISIDSPLPGFRTPYTFVFADGTHSISVPKIDGCGHSFVRWNTGETSTTITVSSRGTYIAYYGLHPTPLPYDVVIETSFNGEGNLNVNIMKDGEFTGFSTPHTFTSLSGVHNFTVPSRGPNGHKFEHWEDASASKTRFTTITVSSGGVYTAFYDVGLCIYVTPFDPGVIEAADNRSWVELLDFVASEINYGDNTHWQMPIETLLQGSGQCRDYSTLYVSMLRASGYEAYVAIGYRNSSGKVEGHAWVVFNEDETLIHVEPQRNLHNQQFVNFTDYHPDYYFNENGIYAPITSENPPIPVTQTEVVMPSAILSVVTVVSLSSSIFLARRKNKDELRPETRL